MTSYPLTPRQRFLKQRWRRQNIVFVSTGAVMLALALISLLVLTGLISAPFVNDFSRDTKYVIPGTTPCPTEGVTPVDPLTIQVRALNATSCQGSASEATTLLVNADYEPLEPNNASLEYAGVMQTDVGPAAVDEAYTAVRFLPKSKVVLSESTDKTVTVLLGIFYDSSSVFDEVGRIVEPKDPSKGSPGCLPLSEESLKKAEQAAAQSGSVEGQSDADSQSENRSSNCELKATAGDQAACDSELSTCSRGVEDSCGP